MWRMLNMMDNSIIDIDDIDDMMNIPFSGGN